MYNVAVRSYDQVFHWLLIGVGSDLNLMGTQKTKHVHPFGLNTSLPILGERESNQNVQGLELGLLQPLPTWVQLNENSEGWS